ncbi:MAG: EAL domain-containing protein, partial [Polyangiales bacterium]
MSESTGCPAEVDAESIHTILSGERGVWLETQPIVDLRRGVITGYEALARFDLDVTTPPDWVFAAANRAGLGIELEALVVQRALALARETPPNCFLSINVDPLHLTAAEVFDPIIAHGPLDGILFELTEQRQIIDMPGVASCLAELRKRGAYVAVDDAGAGYSGLQQILALRPQFLKADRALVSEVDADEAKRAMLQLLGELAGRLDAWIIAEGIETA